jgi:phospholipid transport system substrate-binding protein
MSKTRFIACLLSIGLVVSSNTSFAQAATPDSLVNQVSTEVLVAAKNDASIQAGNPKKIKSLVEEKIVPHVNLALMTSKTIGPKWNTATPAQKERLQTEFRTLLIRTYSGALAQVKDHNVQIKPMRAGSDESNTIVKTEIRGSGTPPIQLDYRFEKSTGSWKIWDVNIAGLWLTSTYQGQFKPALNSNGIDGAIKLLEELNQKAAAAANHG